ncbi:unnamed protein product [Diplocarpon coronariae]
MSDNAERKLVVVIGVTGNQGGSVARQFLSSAKHRVRGLTRAPSSPAALALAGLGVEIAGTDLEDVASLRAAFAGASLIFSVTNYWEPFFRPDQRARAEEVGVTCRAWAGEVERRLGRNICEAAGSEEIVSNLDDTGFIASTLSNARECSGGRFTQLYHFDAKADVFPIYLEERYPELARKASYVQTGYFMSSYRLALGSYFAKLPDDTYQTRFPTSPSVPIPHLAVASDLGAFVHAVAQLPPRRHYLAAGSICSWSDFAATWSRVTGRSAGYVQVERERMVEAVPDRAFGEELADMFEYSSDPGYDGGDPSLWKAEDIRKAGIECPMTSLEDFMRAEDWSLVYNQPAVEAQLASSHSV